MQTKRNKCVYCGSFSYGNGCPFGPRNIHFHPNNSNRCCYCGSISKGSGCPYSPDGNHVHGIEFNTMIQDSIDTGIMLGYVMNMLKSPIENFDAYKNGLISEDYSIVGDYSEIDPVEQYVIGLKQLIGNKLDVLEAAVNLNLESKVNLSEYSNNLEAIDSVKIKLNAMGEDFKSVISDAINRGLSRSLVEKLIVDSLLT